MRIVIVTPALAGSRHGNRNTAMRWERLLRSQGHETTVQVEWDGTPASLMIALHARRSHGSITRFAAARPGQPLIVVLTGTDLYRDIHCDPAAQRSLELATRLVVLQQAGRRELAPELRSKTRVIYQSAARAIPFPRRTREFEVVVSGHLREEKDPFRCAAALGHLPRASRIRVTHIGKAMTPSMAERARLWAAREPRYCWLGELPHDAALRVLARSRLLVISSWMEGGANVVSEALAAGIPVVASRVPGNEGMLGPTWPAYFPAGDEKRLARLLHRAETDEAWYRLLRRRIAARRRLVSTAYEAQALQRLIRELA